MDLFPNEQNFDLEILIHLIRDYIHPTWEKPSPNTLSSATRPTNYRIENYITQINFNER
jgi:hypothetical protein